MKGVLIQDVYSHFSCDKKPYQYGKKGDKVNIISDRDNVLIVENTSTGKRFPAKTEFVTLIK